MKKLLITLTLIVGFMANAQGRREDQNIIHASFGLIPDSKLTSESSYMIKGGYTKVIGKKGFLGKAELFHQNYGVEYIDSQILPYQKSGLSAQAGWSFENFSPVFFNFYLGGFAAYEKVNKGENKDPIYQAPIADKLTGLTYGINGSLEAEVMIYKNISLTVDYSQYYDLKSAFSESSYGIFGGLKIYLN